MGALSQKIPSEIFFIVLPNSELKCLAKILYFNYDQIGLLGKRLMVFLCDYGSGKTVISKEQAIRKAMEDKNKPVYFISLVAADHLGKSGETRYILDILTEWYEFSDSSKGVIPIDVQYLKNFYVTHKGNNNIHMTHNPEFTKLDVLLYKFTSFSKLTVCNM